MKKTYDFFNQPNAQAFHNALDLTATFIAPNKVEVEATEEEIEQATSIAMEFGYRCEASERVQKTYQFRSKTVVAAFHEFCKTHIDKLSARIYNETTITISMTALQSDSVNAYARSFGVLD
jgi:hypothetical protein